MGEVPVLRLLNTVGSSRACRRQLNSSSNFVFHKRKKV